MHWDKKMKSDTYDQRSKTEGPACKTGHLLAKHNTSTSKSRMDVHTKMETITVSCRRVSIDAHADPASERTVHRVSRRLSGFFQEIIAQVAQEAVVVRKRQVREARRNLLASVGACAAGAPFAQRMRARIRAVKPLFSAALISAPHRALGHRAHERERDVSRCDIEHVIFFASFSPPLVRRLSKP